MLAQEESDLILSLVKELRQTREEPIIFPSLKEAITLPATDKENKEYELDIDVQRRTPNPNKCTYQTRFQNDILLRVDVGGPPHSNPDGVIVPCPHLHIYREGYATKFAVPLHEHIPTDTEDLLQVLVDFLEYNKINEEDRPPIRGIGELL